MSTARADALYGEPYLAAVQWQALGVLGQGLLLVPSAKFSLACGCRPCPHRLDIGQGGTPCKCYCTWVVEAVRTSGRPGGPVPLPHHPLPLSTSLPRTLQVLFKLSKGKCLLLKLDVSKCSMSDRDLEALALTIQAVPAVMELDIRGNPLSLQASPRRCLKGATV